MGSEREGDGFGVGKGFENMSSLSHSSKKKKIFNDSRPPADYWTFSHTNNLSIGLISLQGSSKLSQFNGGDVWIGFNYN